MPTRGIRDVTILDVQAAARLDGVVRLIVHSRQDENGQVWAGVEPMLVPQTSQLAGVEDVFNAVLVKGDMLGDVIFYGKGAGKLPTASAVVADVIDALKNGSHIPRQPVLAGGRPCGGPAAGPGARRLPGAGIRCGRERNERFLRRRAGACAGRPALLADPGAHPPMRWKP